MEFTNEDALAHLASFAHPQAEAEEQEPAQEEAAETPEVEATEVHAPAPDMTQPPPMDAATMKQAFIEALMESQKANQPAPQISPEEQQKMEARNALMRELGLDDVFAHNQQLQADLELLKQAHTQAQQEKIVAQLQNDIQAFKGDYHESAEAEVLKHLQGLPPQMASALDNPQGWRLIAEAKGLKKPAQGQAPAVTPDPLVSSNNSTIDTTDGMSKLRSGQMQGVDAGNFIMSLAGSGR